MFLPSRTNPNRNAQSHDVRYYLGLGEKGKLPVEGMLGRSLFGIWVWVEPLRGTHTRKRSTHRVRCECPSCGTHLSVGRLHQHVCKHSTVEFYRGCMPLGTER